MKSPSINVPTLLVLYHSQPVDGPPPPPPSYKPLVYEWRSPSGLLAVASMETSGKLLGADCDVPVGLVSYRDACMCFSKYGCLEISQVVADLG